MGGGACVCWFSRTQKCVTLFTSEAEGVTFGDAVNELFFLRQVLRFMTSGKGMPCFAVFKDNRGTLQLSKNLVSNSNPKQIDVRHHFFKELVRQGDISVNHVLSEYQHADILRTILAFDFFAFHRRFLTNLCDRLSRDLVDWQDMSLCVCMYFQVLAQLGGCSNSSRDEIKGSGGGYEADQ